MAALGWQKQSFKHEAKRKRKISNEKRNHFGKGFKTLTARVQ